MYLTLLLFLLLWLVALLCGSRLLQWHLRYFYNVFFTLGKHEFVFCVYNFNMDDYKDFYVFVVLFFSFSFSSAFLIIVGVWELLLFVLWTMATTYGVDADAGSNHVLLTFTSLHLLCIFCLIALPLLILIVSTTANVWSTACSNWNETERCCTGDGEHNGERYWCGALCVSF